MENRDETQEIDWQEFAEWLHPLQASLQHSEAFSLAPDSILAGDEEGMFDHVSVAAIIRSFLDSAVDQLAAAYALTSEGGRLSPVGLPTLVRGAIELCGVGMWVITGHERVGRQTRALNVAYDSDFNAKKFFTQLSQNDKAPSYVRDEAASAAARHESGCKQSEHNAEMLGIERRAVRAKLNRTAMLKEVDRARQTDFLLYWQLCSGFAHGFAWAPQLFHRHIYTYSMEGGGNLVGRTLDLDGVYDMFQWGRRAIVELQGSFTVGRASFPGHDKTATIIARPQEGPMTPN